MKNPLIGRTLLFILMALLLIGCGKATPLEWEVDSEKECADSRFVTFTNLDSTSITLEGWTIHEDKNYVLPNTVIAAQSSVNIWSGTGTNDAQNIFVGRTTDVWDVKNGINVDLEPKQNLGPFSPVRMYFLGGQVCYPSLSTGNVQSSEPITP
jgi:hypothetical protein